MYETIICDADDRQFEGKFMGLFYTAISRATTLGDANGLNSAIYFTGEHFKEDRIRQIGKRVGSSDDYVPIQQRAKWVQHLKQHTRSINKPTSSMLDTLEWAKHSSYTYDELFHRIKAFQLANVRRKSETFEN